MCKVKYIINIGPNKLTNSFRINITVNPFNKWTKGQITKDEEIIIEQRKENTIINKIKHRL